MALTRVQLKILTLFSDSPIQKHFYWTGGTLLAEKYLHHRQSYDIDFFSDTPFHYEEVLTFIQKIKRDLRLKEIKEKKLFERWEFFVHNHEEVRIEFVYYDFPILKARGKWKGVWIDSLDDLAANKTMATFDRHEPKDIVDIYYLITKKNYTISKLLSLVKKKFGVLIDPSTFLSEILKNLRSILTIRALLLDTPSQQKKMIKKIQEYFQKKSTEYLYRELH